MENEKAEKLADRLRFHQNKEDRTLNLIKRAEHVLQAHDLTRKIMESDIWDLEQDLKSNREIVAEYTDQLKKAKEEK